MTEIQAMRIIAYLLRNEGVSPQAIERAIDSALDMNLGDHICLINDDNTPYRRAFVNEQIRRFMSK
jgi:hypothetical protein